MRTLKYRCRQWAITSKKIWPSDSDTGCSNFPDFSQRMVMFSPFKFVDQKLMRVETGPQHEMLIFIHRSKGGRACIIFCTLPSKLKRRIVGIQVTCGHKIDSCSLSFFLVSILVTRKKLCYTVNWFPDFPIFISDVVSLDLEDMVSIKGLTWTWKLCHSLLSTHHEFLLLCMMRSI